MIAKEDYQQAVNAKNRFAHFPWSRPTLGTLDDFEAVSRGQWTRYQIRITARGRRGTRRTKHGSKTHLSSPTLIEPRPATLKWDATLSIRIDQHILRRARSRSLATHPPPPPPPPRRSSAERSNRSLPPTVRSARDATSGNDVFYPRRREGYTCRGLRGAAVHRAVRSLAECGRGDKRVIAPPRSIRADTTPSGETSEREGARLCLPARWRESVRTRYHAILAVSL